MTQQIIKLVALGCSGPIGGIFVEGFLEQGVQLRLLTRDAKSVSRRYPGAEVRQGSMMNPEDVAKAMSGVDAAFAATPMGLRDDPKSEVAAGRAMIEGAKAAGLKHLIYVSVLGADAPRGVGVLDAKYEIERLLVASGVPHTILRCGSYMEDVFDARLPMLKQGTFLFPVTKHRRFTYTSQRDIAPFVVQALLRPERILNRWFNFAAPGNYSVTEVEAMLSAAAGHPVKARAKVPTYYLFMALTPYFNWTGHRFSTILPLIRYFDRRGYVASGETVGNLFPDFKTTMLEDHLRALLQP